MNYVIRSNGYRNSNIITFQINTSTVEEFINMTSLIQNAVADRCISSGMVIAFCPHITAGITINENVDPDVFHKILYGFNKIYPKKGDYMHFEGNSHAHLKASTVGASQTIIIDAGKLLLGRWQDIYFCEFDGPRNRKVHVKIIEG